MSYSYNNKNKRNTLSEESVIAYLASNPNFLIKNQLLLKEILVPHQLGKNMSSLIEHQVKLLREENIELKNNIEIENTIHIQRGKLRKSIHNFILQIYNVETLEEYNEFFRILLRDFYATLYYRLFIFNDDLDIKDTKNIFFLGNDSKLRFMFTEIFNRNKPLCSSLQTEQLQILFNSDTNKLKSNLLIPINYNNLDGLLALGSEKRNQYSIGEELDLLVFINQLAVLKLKNILKFN